MMLEQNGKNEIIFTGGMGMGGDGMPGVGISGVEMSGVAAEGWTSWLCVHTSMITNSTQEP